MIHKSESNDLQGQTSTRLILKKWIDDDRYSKNLRTGYKIDMIIKFVELFAESGSEYS